MTKYFCDICKSETNAVQGNRSYLVGRFRAASTNSLFPSGDKYDRCDIIDNVCGACSDAINEFIGDLTQ